ncbi:hypothetical protein [Umezawaea sp. Da 62-37]|uniref:hypothetical protein n=1 Tax=Umezawaea sp. Da 62-37 TaxID=3075927 RepID=UPI0028F7456E|nr:hypothetical protein [Umezawaea sp. Da 62-37]WNV87610.1 hypothetical protein RM788_04710 [Umezawaea sp. Da 62-37]
MITGFQQIDVSGQGRIALPATARVSPIVELRNAIRNAIDDLKPVTTAESPDARFERMLLRFTISVGPLRSGFEALTGTDPHGPLAQALKRLTGAFSSAAEGDINATRSALISALGLALRLVKDGEPDAVGIELPTSRSHF